MSEEAGYKRGKQAGEDSGSHFFLCSSCGYDEISCFNFSLNFLSMLNYYLELEDKKTISP